MQRCAMLTTVAVLVLIVTLTPVYASPWDHIFNYTDFNTTTVTWVQTPTHAEWEVQITNALTFNATNAESAQIYLSPTNTLQGIPPPAAQGATFIRVTSWADRTLEVWYSDGDTETRIVYSSSGWIAGDNTILLTYNGKLNVGYTTDPDALLSNYAISEMPLSYVGVFGEENVKVCDDGFLTVAIKSGATKKVMNLVLSFIPLIVTIAMLGVVVAIMKRLQL